MTTLEDLDSLLRGEGVIGVDIRHTPSDKSGQTGFMIAVHADGKPHPSYYFGYGLQAAIDTARREHFPKED